MWNEFVVGRIVNFVRPQLINIFIYRGKEKKKRKELALVHRMLSLSSKFLLWNVFCCALKIYISSVTHSKLLLFHFYFYFVLASLLSSSQFLFHDRVCLTLFKHSHALHISILHVYFIVAYAAYAIYNM